MFGPPASRPLASACALATALLASRARAQPASPHAPQPFGAQICAECAAADADRDGIPDAFDLCPNRAETTNGFEDGDGCPDDAGSQLASAAKSVGFRPGSDRLDKSALATLRTLAAALRGTSADTLGPVDVIGYAERAGADARKPDLGQRRAEAVRAALVRSGVPESRLRAVGAVAPGAGARRAEVRPVSDRHQGLYHGAAAPDLRLASGWQVRHAGAAGQLELVSASGAVYPAYAVRKRDPWWALYGRSATGHEVDLILGLQPGVPPVALVRLRGPGGPGGWTGGALVRQWLDRPQTGAAPPLDPARPAPVTIASGLAQPGALAVYGTMAYVVAGGAILRVPKSGGTPAVVVPSANATSIAADGTHLYWTQADRVLRSLKEGGGGTPIATRQSSPREVTVWGNHVYWLADDPRAPSASFVMRMLRFGTGPVAVTTADTPVGLSVTEAGVLWASLARGTVEHLGAPGTPPARLASGRRGPVDLACDTSHAYWLDDEGLMQASLAAGAPVRLSATTGRRLVLDGDNVYWVSGKPSAGSGDGIVRMPKSGGRQAMIVAEGAYDLAVDETRVYWTRRSVGEGGTLEAMDK
jgi:outer membrane protein OmpA-like peptidoglycan-associated protein